jgi:site-specific recombinase XerD
MILLYRGIDIRQLKQYLGHSKVKTKIFYLFEVRNERYLFISLTGSKESYNILTLNTT